MVVSADQSGVLEYWSGVEGSYHHPNNVLFESKLETDLYEFIKVRYRETDKHSIYNYHWDNCRERMSER